MNLRNSLFVSSIVCFIALGGAAIHSEEKDAEKLSGMGRVSVGEYIEMDEKGVANERLALMIQEALPNIIHLRGINGWIAFASYDEDKKEYRGFFEWREFGPMRSPEGKWADLYQIVLIKNEDGQIRMSGKSKTNEFVIRAKIKK